MKSAKRAIKKAAKSSIEALLTANAITAGVTATPLETEVFPYVFIGDELETDLSNKASDVSTVIQAYTVWSKSLDEAETIIELIQEELTGAVKLSLDAPFSIIDQLLDLNPPAFTDTTSANTYFGASVRVRYQVQH